MKQSFKKSLSVALATLLLLFSFPLTATADYVFESNPTVYDAQVSYGYGQYVSYYPDHAQSKKIPFSFVDSSITNPENVVLSFRYSADLSSLGENDGLTFTYQIFPSTASVKKWKLQIFTNYGNGSVVSETESTTDYASVTFEDIGYYTHGDSLPVQFYFSVYYEDATDSYLRTGCNSLNVQVTDSTKGLLQTILEWLQNIRDRIVELPNSIGSFITSLGNNIKGFFTDLKNNLSSWFDDVGDWFSNLGDNLREWFSNVGDWFSQLGDRISGFFVNLSNNISDYFKKLFNKLWWGNEQGEAAYQPPTFGSGLTEVLESIDTYILSLEDTQTAIDNSKTEVVGYVAQGTEIINGFLGVAPTIVIAVLVFAVALLFARKVVGR